jgi:hypothetical protein
MAHYVQRKGYWSLEESYRDERGKPRKRYLKYLGKLGQIDWSATLNGFPEDRGLHAAERAAEKADALRGPVVKEPSKLPVGLHVGPTDPMPVDTNPEAEQEQTPDTPEPGSDDASGNSSLE